MRPVSSQAKIVLNKDASTALPKLFASLVLEEINILVSRQQVNMRCANVNKSLLLCYAIYDLLWKVVFLERFAVIPDVGLDGLS